MSGKAIFILVLVVLVLGAGGAFYVVFQQKQTETQASRQLLQAQAIYQDGGQDKAVAILTDLIEKYPRSKTKAQALFDLARIYESNAPAQSLGLFERYLQEHPKGELVLEAHRQCARLALAQNQIDKAQSHYQFLQSLRQEPYHSTGIVGLAAIAESQGKVEEAREAYYRIIAEVTGQQEIINEAMDRLSKINTDMLFTQRVNEFTQRYAVERGDNPLVIGAKFGSTAYMIQAMNNMTERTLLRNGQSITVPRPGGVRIVVSKSAKSLYLYSNMEGTQGKFIKRYPVGVAQFGERTPPGIYVITEKQLDPTWYPPQGGRIPPGVPENALGSRWMGFSRDGKSTSLGIHGTNAPETIGSASSAGCIRMHNEDVEELFMIARQGTEVEIVE